ARPPEVPPAPRATGRGAPTCVAWFSLPGSANDVRLHAFGNDSPEALIPIRAHDERMRVAGRPRGERGKTRRGIVEDRVVLYLHVDPFFPRDIDKVRDGTDVLRKSRRGRVRRRQHGAAEQTRHMARAAVPHGEYEAQ